MKSVQFTTAVLLAGLLAVGCGGGGNKLIVGNISGPDSVDEGVWAQYEVDASGDSGITCQWSVDPAGAAEFDKTDGLKVKIKPVEVSGDTMVVLGVMIVSDKDGPVVREKDVTILDVGDHGGNLLVGAIQGPLSLDSAETGAYSVSASGDTGITYQWSCEPVNAGAFDSPTSASTDFTAASVTQDIDISIRVEVNSDNGGPVTKSLVVLIMEPPSQHPNGWARTWGSHYTYGFPETGYGLAPDGYGGVYVAGSFFHHADFDPGPGQDLQYLDAFSPGAYLCTYGSDGNYLWSRVWGGGGSTTARDVEVDASGNVYVVGYFEGVADFDPSLTMYWTAESHGYSDAFISKFDSGGNHIWTDTWGGTGSDTAASVEIDEEGHIYISGSFEHLVDFNPHYSLEESRWSAGGADGYLLKLDYTSAFKWVLTWGGNYNDLTNDMAVDSKGALYITGTFGSVGGDFAPGPQVHELSPVGEYDAYLIKYDPKNDFQWALSLGGTSMDYGIQVAVDGSRNVYCVGSFESFVDLDPGPGDAEHTSYGYFDGFLVKFNPSGQYCWDATFGWDGQDSGCAVDVCSDDSVIVGGGFQGTVDLDMEGTHKYLYTPSLGAFLLKLNKDGGYRWAQSWDTGAYFAPTDPLARILVNEDDSIYATGLFMGSKDFDPGPNVEIHTADGDMDCYLVLMPSDGNW